MIVNERVAERCRTPDGTPDYMCAEKQYNLKRVANITDYKNYSTSADIWSLGVLILHMQLCVRMTQSGDGHLKQYLNDTMLNFDSSTRPTAKQILESYLIKKWCNENLEQDKNYLVKLFIYELDWQNRSKLDIDGYNYDACEAVRNFNF
ncbi:unnamed protein product [Acanthocheilonema viteae]|uniref:Protein kinase domain-containing protein n=1 Tax=Acanthocheilonema viteae TaxID=6277 RepID=A0A498RXC1_ACAVI|nr:unnamed protein product [Acanthocheilonema viteae]